MQAAMDEAKKALEIEETPIGAVVVRNGEIIGRGFNMTETLSDPTAHAEIMAIKDACRNSDYWRLFDCSIYITLEPCPMCSGAIINSKIKNVYVGMEHIKNHKVDRELELSKELFAINKVGYECFYIEEAGEILSDFFKKLRKRKKENKI